MGIFEENNTVDLWCKGVLVMFLIFATSYIDYSVMSQSDVDGTNNFLGRMTVALICLAVGIALAFMLNWLWRQLRPQGYNLGHSARIVFRFREAMLAQGLLTEQEVL